MKTKVLLMFGYPPDQKATCQRLLRDMLIRANRKDLVDREDLTPSGEPSIGWAVWLDDDDPAAAFFRQRLRELEKEGVDWYERRERSYTKTELRMSPFLRFILRSAEKGYGGPRWGTEYDLSKACPKCGTGAVQISSLILKPSEIPKKGAIFQTLDCEYLVSEELADGLRKAEVTGLELRQARSHKGRLLLPWWQIVSKHEMPPMASTTTGFLRDKPCPRCGRDGYFDNVEEPAHIRYTDDTDALPDVAHTHERFGNGALREPLEKSHFAAPLLLVKPGVFEIFEKQKVRGVKFEPVQVVPSASTSTTATTT